MPYLLFTISGLGIILNRHHLLLFLICLEALLLSITLLILTYGINNVFFISMPWAVILITIAAIESAIGLSLLIAFYKIRGTIAVQIMNFLKG